MRSGGSHLVAGGAGRASSLLLAFGSSRASGLACLLGLAFDASGVALACLGIGLFVRVWRAPHRALPSRALTKNSAFSDEKLRLLGRKTQRLRRVVVPRETNTVFVSRACRPTRPSEFSDERTSFLARARFRHSILWLPRNQACTPSLHLSFPLILGRAPRRSPRLRQPRPWQVRREPSLLRLSTFREKYAKRCDNY